MEETNYDRPSILNDQAQLAAAASHSDAIEHDEAYNDKPVSIEGNHAEHVQSRSPAQYQKKSYWAKLKIFDKRRPLQHWLFGIIRPLKLMTFPVIAYCGFNYGASLIWYNVLNATSSLILSGAPYNFPA